MQILIRVTLQQTNVEKLEIELPPYEIVVTKR